MASKFGLLGDLDNVLGDLRRLIGHAASNVYKIRQALENKAITKGELSEDKGSQVLKEVENILDGLINR